MTQETIIETSDFGFRNTETGWTKIIADKRYDFKILTDSSEMEKVVDLQKRVWMMPDRDLVPSNLLAIAENTGGNVIGAYTDNDRMSGFTFTLGTTSRKQFLHMIGVDNEVRYRDLGWNLSILMAATATHNGIKNIEWTYDPLRGGNARLNLEKLGAMPYEFTINKYGIVKSELYGENPTDRFTVNWNLGSRWVRQKLQETNQGKIRPHNLDDVKNVPVIVKPEEVSLQKIIAVEIPGDNDKLEDKEAIKWRMQFREVMRKVMTTKDNGKVTHGEYQPFAFATGLEGMKRRSYYLLEKK